MYSVLINIRFATIPIGDSLHMKKQITKNFTEGNISKQLLMFTLPFMASNALLVLYSTIDMMIVGQYVGTAGLSAVSQSSLIINFATLHVSNGII